MPARMAERDTPGLAALGWSSFFAAQQRELAPETLPARVSAVTRRTFTLRTADATRTVRLQDAGALDEMPAVGDWLLCDPTTGDPRYPIQRKNVLRRRRSGSAHGTQILLANFEHVALVTSANQEFSESRLERGLVLAAQSGATPLVVLTKVDLCEDIGRFRQRLARIPALPLTFELDARSDASVGLLADHLRLGETLALLGSSGVGKSTLLNTLVGFRRQATQPIRASDSKGRHTTVNRTLISLPSGALVVDNPGVRELGIVGARAAVAAVFADVAALAARCRFNDCQHQAEPNCAVQNALQEGTLDQRRFNNFVKLTAEAAMS